MMRMGKKTNSMVKMGIVGVVLLVCSIATGFAEDMYYLENELRETDAKRAIISADLARAENFINSYPANVAALGKAYDELCALETKMRDLLQKNLVKSTIRLGYDTYGKVSLVLDFAEQSAKTIIVACATELAGDQMQDSFGSPYTVVVKGLSEQARKLAPEIDEVHRTLAMSMDEVKADAMKAGDQLGDTGALYRKFYMILEAIEKAKKAMYELRKNLDQTKGDVQAKLPDIKAEADRLEERVQELNGRISQAQQQKIGELMQPLIEQAQASSKPAIAPAPSGNLDDEKRQKLIAQKTSELYSVLQQGRNEYDKLVAAMNTAVLQPTNDGGTYNPLENKISVLPIVKPLTPELVKNWDLSQLKAEETFQKAQIELNTKLIAILKQYQGKFAGLQTSISNTATPIMSVLAGLGAGADPTGAFQPVMYDITMQVVNLPILVSTLEKEITILQNNIPLYTKEHDRQIAEVKSLVSMVTTESAAAINAASLAAATAHEVFLEGEALRATAGKEFTIALGTVRNTVRTMFESGDATANVRSYIEKERAPFIAMYEKSAKVAHMAKLRDNTREAFEAKVQAHPYYALIMNIVQYHPEENIKNPMDTYAEQYWQYCGNKSIDEIYEAQLIAGQTFNIVNQMNDILEYLPKIDDINRRIIAVMSSKPYPEAMQERAKIVAELNTDRELLNKWLNSYASPDGKTPGMYMIFSKEAVQATEKASLAYQAKEDAKNKAAAEEEQKKQEKENREQYKKTSPDGLASYYGYSLADTRVNTYSLARASGDVVLTNEEIGQGLMELTGRLTTIDRIQTLLISNDGGRTWSELGVAESISYSFTPVPGRLYEPVLRIKTTDSETIDMPFFGRRVSSITYQNIDFQTMVLDTVKAVADAYEQQNVSAFAQFISKDYLGNRTFLEEGVRYDFDMFTDIKMDIYVNRIQKSGGNFIAETKWDKVQVPRTTGQQQVTNGRTTFTFVLEDDRMKIKNLRGNLIYATLSPEIAQASGLPTATVDAIRTAVDDRNPTQPGAAEIEDDGGVPGGGGGSGTILENAGCVILVDNGYDLANNSQVAFNGDISYAFWAPDNMLMRGGASGGSQLIGGAANLSDVTTAPAGGYMIDLEVTAGSVYVVETEDGHYAKLKITSINPGVSMTFEYAYQTEAGNTDLTT